MLYSSVLHPFDCPAYELSGLSLVAGLAVCEALETFGARKVGLKWPNDLLFGARKLGGILIELGPNGSQGTHSVTGIGLNLSDFSTRSAIDQGVATLDEIVARLPERNTLLAALIQHLLSNYQAYSRSGFDAFAERWGERDAYRGRELVLEHINGTRVFGRSMGVTARGELRLATSDGERAFHSGEISMRP